MLTHCNGIRDGRSTRFSYPLSLFQAPWPDQHPVYSGAAKCHIAIKAKFQSILNEKLWRTPASQPRLQHQEFAI